MERRRRHVHGRGRGGALARPTGITTPAQSRLTVKVTEPIDGTSQSVSSTVTVRVHNSIKEITDISVQFLLDFSDQKNAPEYVIRNFYTGCPGRNEELQDVTNNRLNYTITSYKIGTPTSASVNFGGTCPYQNKKGVRRLRADAGGMESD